MDFIRISSKENAIIKEIALLQKSSSKRKEEALFVLEGLRLCQDAAQNNYSVKTLVVSDTAAEKYAESIAEICRVAAEKYIIPDSLFQKIADTVSPQGVLCVCDLPKATKYSVSASGKYIALENLQDPSNLGAISRTAEALGISGLIVQGGADPFSPKSLRASMGALLRIPVIQTNDMFEVFKSASIKSYASVVHETAESVCTQTFKGGCAVIIGNEANGLTNETILKATKSITIPMSGCAESLNAAVAASILMWEMTKC